MTTEVWDNDTLAHILLLREQREELREDQDQAVLQWVQELARADQAGTLTGEDLLAALHTFCDVVGLPSPDYLLATGTSWCDAGLPVEKEIQRRIRHATNRIFEKTWRGDFPLDAEQGCPALGLPVVYVLYDATNEPLYVGRSDCFRRRMSSHRQRFKDAASSWLAYECESLEHSKRLESELLHDRKPPVNVRLERSA